MAATKMSLGTLPIELRLMILEALVQDENCLARYATVCREWQPVIEKKTFSRLKLTLPRLAHFYDMTLLRRRLVKYIWLCIELQEYDCSLCEIEKSSSWHKSNTAIVKKAIWDFSFVLSTWEPTGSLLLDISVHSPSDSRHRFKGLHFEPDAVPESDHEQETTYIHNPRHRCYNEKHVSLQPERRSINRLFEDIELELDFWEKLPKIRAVTGVLLRRQTRRR